MIQYIQTITTTLIRINATRIRSNKKPTRMICVEGKPSDCLKIQMPGRNIENPFEFPIVKKFAKSLNCYMSIWNCRSLI